MLIKYMMGWFILMIAAVINGTLRESLYRPFVGDLAAHQISTFSGIVLFGVIIWGMSRLWPIPGAQKAWAIGAVWLGMTICFEFLFGHYVMGNSWAILLYDYNILKGRLWVLLLGWILVAPYVFFKIRHKDA